MASNCKTETDGIDHFAAFLERAKRLNLIEDYQYNKETMTAKIKPYFSMRPIFYFMVVVDWDI